MMKPNAKLVKIREQIIDDPATGLMLVFRVTQIDKEPSLQIIGSAFPFGNRDFQFNKKGEYIGTGTGLADCDINND
jgi:hypothetical protein